MTELVAVLDEFLILSLEHVDKLVPLADDAHHKDDVGPEDGFS